MTDVYVEHFAGSPSTIATLLVLGMIAIAVATSVRRRRLLVLAAGLSAALVGGLTLAPAAGWSTFTVTADPAASILTALTPVAGDLAIWRTADGPANVALFVPLGLTLGLLWRRPILAALTAAILSVGIEAYQAATGTRVGSFADVVANSLGGVVGATVAAVVLLGLGVTRIMRDRWSRPARTAATAAYR